MPLDTMPLYSVPDVEKIIENHERDIKLKEIEVRRLTSEVRLLKDKVTDLFSENFNLKSEVKRLKDSITELLAEKFFSDNEGDL